MRRSMLLVSAPAWSSRPRRPGSRRAERAGDAASPAPSATVPGSAGGRVPPGPAAGTKMAPGLYDLEDGTVVAVGTVEYRDLEGGFWAVIGGTQAEGDAGTVVAVIANGDEYAEQFRRNAGPLVRGLRRAGRRRVHPDGRPGDHRDARRARGRGRAGGVARRRRGAAPVTRPDSASRIRWRRGERALPSETWTRRHRERGGPRPGAATMLPREEMLTALRERDRSYDGLFYAAVTTTGIFCRPSCPARDPQARARGVLRDDARGARGRLSAVQAVPAARRGGRHSRVGVAADRARRGRPRGAHHRRRPARRGPGPGGRAPLVPEDARHDVPGLLPGPPARRRVRRAPLRRRHRRGGLRPRLGLALRLPDGVRQAGRGAARRSGGGARRLARPPDLAGDAGRPAGRRRDRPRRVPARVPRPAHDGDAAGHAAPALRPPARPRRQPAVRASARAAGRVLRRAGDAPSTCRSSTPAAPSSAASGTRCGASPTARRAPTPSSPARSARRARRAPWAAPTAPTGSRSSSRATG